MSEEQHRREIEGRFLLESIVAGMSVGQALDIFGSACNRPGTLFAPGHWLQPKLEQFRAKLRDPLSDEEATVLRDVLGKVARIEDALEWLESREDWHSLQNQKQRQRQMADLAKREIERKRASEALRHHQPPFRVTAETQSLEVILRKGMPAKDTKQPTLAHGLCALAKGLQTVSREPDDIRSRIAGFRGSYVEHWKEWCTTLKRFGLCSNEAAQCFRSILGRWQVARLKGLKLRDPQEYEGLLKSIAPELSVLKECDLRTFRNLTADQQDAFQILWNTFEAKLVQGGYARVVGISKGIMLVTEGRIGPALDAFVAKALKCGNASNADELSAVYTDVANWLATLEARHSIRLEDLVPDDWRPLNIGRVVDMVLGPRDHNLGSRKDAARCHFGAAFVN